jgi:hypothetical protein
MKTRNRKRMTMPEAMFFRLYSAHRAAMKEGKQCELIPVHAFMGEIWCEEVGKWGFVSYECAARAAEIYHENPGLLYREYIRGRSGAKYYGYRIHAKANADCIKDPTLKTLYAHLRAKMPV